jgi:hypothetical protein
MFVLMTGLSFFLSAASVPGELVAPPKPEIRLAIGDSVEARQLLRRATGEPFVSGDHLVAWTEVAGVSWSFLEHVWRRNGVEVARHYLPVGSRRRWRSWSRHLVRAGHYEVRVLAPDGSQLAVQVFDVAAGSIQPPDEDDEGC